MYVGPCNGEQIQWYYNKDTDTCEEFNYGGCQGNDNRFNDRGSCEQRCKRHHEPPESIHPLTTHAPGSVYLNINF